MKTNYWRVIRVIVLAALALVVFNAHISAHEVRPGYLELKQQSAEIYDVFWKVPGRGNMRLGLYVKVPQNCKPISLHNQYGTGDAFIERWTLKCEGGLSGQTISIDGLSSTITDVIVRVERLGGSIQATRLTASSPSFLVEADPGRLQVASTYLQLGIEHILLGIDHLLFVLSLLLIVTAMRPLLKTVTAFTLAHSITLGLSAVGVVHVPPAPVEVVVALSIVFVAAEIIYLQKGRSSLTAKAPWIVAFVFGLLHGFGFAGALSEMGLPQGNIPMALLSFNLGVELGQILFISVVVSLLWSLKRLEFNSPKWARSIPPYAIGSAAMFWVIQRIAAF